MHTYRYIVLMLEATSNCNGKKINRRTTEQTYNRTTEQQQANSRVKQTAVAGSSPQVLVITKCCVCVPECRVLPVPPHGNCHDRLRSARTSAMLQHCNIVCCLCYSCCLVCVVLTLLFCLCVLLFGLNCNLQPSSQSRSSVQPHEARCPLKLRRQSRRHAVNLLLNQSPKTISSLCCSIALLLVFKDCIKMIVSSCIPKIKPRAQR